MPDRKISLYAIAACESMTDNIYVFCKCKDKYSWCATRRCACVKAGFKYRVAYYKREDNDNIKCHNLEILHLRLQKGLWVEDKDDKKESSKR